MDKQRIFILTLFFLIGLHQANTADKTVASKIQIDLAVLQGYITPSLDVLSTTNVSIQHNHCMQKSSSCAGGRSELITITSNSKRFCWRQLHLERDGCYTDPAIFALTVGGTIRLKMTRNWAWDRVATIALECLQSDDIPTINDKPDSRLYRWEKEHRKGIDVEVKSGSDSWENLTTEPSHSFTIACHKTESSESPTTASTQVNSQTTADVTTFTIEAEFTHSENATQKMTQTERPTNLKNGNEKKGGNSKTVLISGTVSGGVLLIVVGISLLVLIKKKRLNKQYQDKPVDTFSPDHSDTVYNDDSCGDYYNILHGQHVNDINTQDSHNEDNSASNYDAVSYHLEIPESDKTIPKSQRDQEYSTVVDESLYSKPDKRPRSRAVDHSEQVTMIDNDIYEGGEHEVDSDDDVIYSLADAI